MCVLSPALCDPWTVACQAPLPMAFSRQEYWSGLPFPSPEDLPDPGIKPGSPAFQADSLPSEPQAKPYVIRVNLYFLFYNIPLWDYIEVYFLLMNFWIVLFFKIISLATTNIQTFLYMPLEVNVKLLGHRIW